MRVYLPSTLAGLAELSRSERVGPPPLAASAVTPGLREWYAEGGSEELEYVALTEAARLSLALLAADPDLPRRRVVLAADLPDAAVTPSPADGRAAVTVGVEVPLGWVASVHADDADAEQTVRAAAACLAAAERGDEQARFAVEDSDACELAWYATQEIDYLVGGP